VHDGLVAECLLLWIPLEVKHEHLDHESVASGGCQVDGLAPHVTVSMLGHLMFGRIVVRKLVPHRVQNLVCLFKAYELQKIHVVLEAHMQVLFAA